MTLISSPCSPLQAVPAQAALTHLPALAWPLDELARTHLRKPRAFAWGLCVASHQGYGLVAVVFRPYPHHRAMNRWSKWSPLHLNYNHPKNWLHMFAWFYVQVAGYDDRLQRIHQHSRPNSVERHAECRVYNMLFSKPRIHLKTWKEMGALSECKCSLALCCSTCWINECSTLPRNKFTTSVEKIIHTVFIREHFEAWH